MSQTERAQMEQCMDHLAYILEKLGVQEAVFANGTARFDTNQQTFNSRLMNDFCHHISSLYKEEMVEDAENADHDEYFSV